MIVLGVAGAWLLAGTMPLPVAVVGGLGAAGVGAWLAPRVAEALFGAGVRATESGRQRGATVATVLALVVDGFALRTPASRQRRVRMLYNISSFAARAGWDGIHHVALARNVAAARALDRRHPDDDNTQMLAEALHHAAVCEATHKPGSRPARRARATSLVEESLAQYERIAHRPEIGPGCRLALDLHHDLTAHNRST